MKRIMKYRVWLLVLFVLSIVLAPSIALPGHSHANRSAVTPESEFGATSYTRLAKSTDASQLTGLSKGAAPDQSFGSFALNVARRGHTSTSLDDGRVVIIGGQNQSGPVREIELLDLGSQSINVAAALRVPRSRHTSTALANGTVLVAGGWNQKDKFNSTEIFDPRTNAVSRGPRLRQPRAAHAATVLKDGRVLITGGSGDASAEIFDPATNTSILLGSKMTAARSFHSTALLKDGSVLIVGGIDPEGLRLRSAEVFDTKTFRFSPTLEPMKIKRARATLRVLPDAKVQIIGGDFDGTMEVYDPAFNRFHAAAHLAPTTSIFPTSRLLQSRTRAALIDSKITLDDAATTNPAKQFQHYSIANKNVLDSFDQLLERSDYSSTEVSGASRAVISGGIDKSDGYLRSVVVMASSAAAITTNESEYVPGEQVFINGSGFQPHEAIRIARQEARTGHRRKYIEVVADDDGNFSSTDISRADFQQGVTYTLTAMGERSGAVAQTTYSDVRLEQAKPEELKLDMPVLFRDASYEIAAGLMIWDLKKQLQPATKPPEFSIQAKASSTTFEFADVEDKPCLGLPVCLLPAGIDIQLKHDSKLTVSADVSGSLSPPSLTFSESVNGTFLIQVTGKGDILSIDIPIPGASVSFMIEVGGVVDLELEIGIVAKPTISLTDPGTTVLITFGLNESLTFTFPPPSGGSVVTGSITPTLAFSLVSTAGGCLKIPIGPEISLSGGITVGGCTVGADASVFGGPFVKGCFNVTQGACPTWSIPISVGITAEAEANISFCASIGTSVDADFFETTVATFTGNLNDTTPPTITCPGSMTVPTSPNGCTATPTFAPTASDGACPAPTVTCTPASGSTFAKGVTTVTCTATDKGGNVSAPCTFTVTVQDQQAPTVSCPANITLSNDPSQCGAVATFSATPSDNCMGATASCTPASGSFFPKGTTTVSCKATDASGNMSSACTFTVTVNDTQPPTITCPANIVRSNDPNQCGAVVSFASTVSDNCPGATATCTPASGSFFPKGTTSVSCKATDASGNMSLSSCTFTVTVNDTQPPTITCPPNQTAVTPTIGGVSVAVTYPAPVATDNCPGVTAACVPPSGSTFPVGCTTVTCTATDASSNTATCQFTVCVFNICLQDDSNGFNRILINSFTGDYRFCCNGMIFTGRGKMTIQGSTYGLEHNPLDRRVRASVTAPATSGNASLQMPPGKLRCNVTDSNTKNNTNCTTCQ